MIPNPGYWIECSRQVTTSGINTLDQNLEEEEEDHDDRDDEGLGLSEASRPRRMSVAPEERPRKKSNIEEHWLRYGSFDLTSVLQVTFSSYP